MAVLTDVVNLTLDGTIQTVTVPHPPSAVTFQCRTNDDVLFYDSVTGSDYFTVKGGGSITFASHNMQQDEFFVKGTNATVLEILYFQD